MTFVTASRGQFAAAVATALLALGGCNADNDKVSTAAPVATAAEVAVPEPAPLPPPPKPVMRQARTAPKSPAKPQSNGAEHAQDTAHDTAEKSEGTVAATAPGTPAPSEVPTAGAPDEQQLALRSPGVRAPIRLIGLNRNATTALLGAPSEERQVAVARVWDYRGPDCRLAVYFYLDTGRNDFYALHYEIDGPEAGPDAEQHCLQRIRDARGN